MVLTHNTLSCATKGCFAAITLHPDDEARLRRTHETFYCPAGHHNYFAGATKQEKRIAELEATVEKVRSSHHRALDRLSELHAQREEMLGSLKECPLGCGWRSRRYPSSRSAYDIGRMRERVLTDLRLHLVDEHGAALPEPVEEEVPA